MKKVLLWTAALSLLVALPLAAGEDKAQMEAMKAEFSKCMMCKNFVPVMGELLPVMENEIVKLDNGMAMVHSVKDPQKVKLLHDVHAKLAASGPACIALSDADAKTQLCSLCQDIRSLVKAGAQMSTGTTKSGDIMVLTSTDPVVQKQLTSFESKCATMMAASH